MSSRASSAESNLLEKVLQCKQSYVFDIVIDTDIVEVVPFFSVSRPDDILLPGTRVCAFRHI